MAAQTLRRDSDAAFAPYFDTRECLQYACAWRAGSTGRGEPDENVLQKKSRHTSPPPTSEANKAHSFQIAPNEAISAHRLPRYFSGLACLCSSFFCLLLSSMCWRVLWYTYETQSWSVKCARVLEQTVERATKDLPTSQVSFLSLSLSLPPPGFFKSACRL